MKKYGQRLTDKIKKDFNFFTYVSGKWNNSSKTGSFYLNVNNSTSNRNRNISGHLVNAYEHVKIFALPLGKI